MEHNSDVLAKKKRVETENIFSCKLEICRGRRKKKCNGNVTNLFVCHECQMFFSILTLFSNLFYGTKERNSKKISHFECRKSELYFHLNDPQRKKKLQQDFYLQNQDAIKILLRFFFRSVVCRLAHYPTWLHIFMYLQFKSRNHYNIREQFSSILLQPSLREHWEISLDNRSSVHEFLMHFSRLLSSFLTHPHVLRWKCIGNFHSLNIFFHFTVEWVSNLNFWTIIRIAFTISFN